MAVHEPLTEGTWLCTRCGVEKHVTEFTPDRNNLGGRQHQCRQCKTDAQRLRRQGNPQPPAVALKYLHGMSLEEYNQRLEVQNGVCDSCGNPESQLLKDGSVRPLSVDHDHNRACGHAGKRSCSQCNRGLLCAHCNHALGYARDDVKALMQLVDYLHRYDSC